MLPFLKKNQEASASAPIDPVKRKPDEESDDYDSLESAAQDLLHAIKEEDTKAIAAALRAAFDLCDSEPHHEGPHV